jgi:XTP/dITP diphosphohydrolase
VVFIKPKTSILLATGNAAKIQEFSAMLSSRALSVMSLAEFPKTLPEPPEENGLDFLENAVLKARYYNQATGLICLADDSGLCVSGLGDRPGVYSARFGGPGLSDRQRCLKLLDEAETLTDRRAFFQAALVLANGPQILVGSGRLDGLLSIKPKGTGGFGYDCLFIPLGFKRTLAELSPKTKNRISHRFKALQALEKEISQQPGFFSS